MASSRNITNIYESYLDLSFVDKRNFNGRILPAAMVSSFIPCHKIRNFYKDTLYYLHLHASLYYELYYFNRNNNNDIAKFKKCIESLQIIIFTGKFDTRLTKLSDDNTNRIIGRLLYDDDGGNAKFYFSVNHFKYNYKTTTTGNGYKNYDDSVNTENLSRQISIIPVLSNISDINDMDTTLPAQNQGQIFSKSDISNQSLYGSFSFDYNEESYNYMMRKIILKGILSQGHENIMSYLLNLCIINIIRINYKEKFN